MSGGLSGVTIGYQFNLIKFDWPRWHELANANFTKIDAILRSYISNGIKGSWLNSTAYVVGDKLLDEEEGLIFVCSVSHTSAATGTFTADRVAHPTYWKSLLFEPEAKGLWTTATTYKLGDFVSHGAVYAYCNATHVSGVWATDVAAGYWEILIDAQSSVDTATTSATNAATSAALASGYKDAALTYKDAAQTSATNAGTSATNAANSATSASGSATTATTQATTATTQAGIATTQAGIATTKASEAAASAVTAVAATVTKASIRNKLINSVFQVCQDRATAATLTVSSSTYVFDNMYALVSGGGTLLGSQIVKQTPSGAQTRAHFTIGTSDNSLAAGDLYGLVQFVEGSDIDDLLFGASLAKPFTYACIVSLPAGNYALSFCNNTADRSYVYPFTVAAGEADTDKLVTVTVPGDQFGTWTKDSTGIGLQVRLCLASGTTRQTASPNAWIAGNYCTTSAQTNAMALAANVFEWADTRLYQGVDLPTFEVPRLIDDLLACRRLWRTGFISGGGYATAAVGGFHVHNERFGTPMRAIPAIAYSGVTYSNCSAIAAGLISADGFATTITASAANTNYSASATFTSNSRL